MSSEETLSAGETITIGLPLSTPAASITFSKASFVGIIDFNFTPATVRSSRIVENST